MKNIFLPLMLVLLVAACAPRDIAQGGSNQKNGGGPKTVNVNEYFVLKNNGDLSTTCQAGGKPGKPYSTMNPPANEDAQIFSGKVTAFLEAGDKNCFRIGDVVEIKDHKDPNAVSRGKVKITGVEIQHISRLTQAQADKFGLSLSQFQQRAQAALNSVTYNHAEMISLTYFEYQNGVAPVTPPTTTDPGTVTTPATGVEIFVDEEGILPPTCTSGKAYSSVFEITPDQDAAVASGEIRAFMAPGDRNCYRIGDVLPVKGKKTAIDMDPQERAKIKILAVYINPVSQVNEVQAILMNTTLPQLRTDAQAMVDAAKAAGKFDPKDMVTVTVFEYQQPAQ